MSKKKKKKSKSADYSFPIYMFPEGKGMLTDYDEMNTDHPDYLGHITVFADLDEKSKAKPCFGIKVVSSKQAMRISRHFRQLARVMHQEKMEKLYEKLEGWLWRTRLISWRS